MNGSLSVAMNRVLRRQRRAGCAACQFAHKIKGFRDAGYESKTLDLVAALTNPRKSRHAPARIQIA